MNFYKKMNDWDKEFREWKDRREPKKLNDFRYQDVIKKEVVAVEREVSDAFDFSKPAPSERVKIERIIIVALYVIVLGAALYFIIVSLFPNAIPFANTYTISASDSKLFSLNSFYIDDSSVLGDKVSVNEKVVRPIVSSKKFNLVFKPKENIPSERSAQLTLSLVFNNSNATDIYLNNELVFPSLTNYDLAFENGNDLVYVKKEISAYTKTDNSSESAEEFLYSLPSASVWSSRILNPPSIKLQDYSPKQTLINGTFRDNLKLAVYAENSLNLSFVKQDLNGYLGEDEYTVNVTDIANKVVFSQIYGDDGIRTKSVLGKEQPFSISVDNLKGGVYYIQFTKDGYNDAADSSIKSIAINSNKILIVGQFLPWSPFGFYTKADYPKTIGFTYWWGGKDQTIKINNDNLVLAVDQINIRNDKLLDSGQYGITTPKGYLWVYSDVASPSNNTWFDLPSLAMTSQSPSYIILDKASFNNLEFTTSKEIMLTQQTTKINLRALDANTAYFNNAELKTL